jgi:hypothetical protein
MLIHRNPAVIVASSGLPYGHRPLSLTIYSFPYGRPPCLGWPSDTLMSVGYRYEFILQSR